MYFPLNKRGGWIVPDETVIPDHTIVPPYSQFGNWCKFGNWCNFGNACEFGNVCKFGNSCKFGNACKFGNLCKFGNACEFGNVCEFDNVCEFGNACKLGYECIVEGVQMQWIMTAANIDGSGRQILIVSDGDKVLVRAGCFLGSVEEFTAKAKSEGKHFYAAVIPAMVAARQSINEAAP